MVLDSEPEAAMGETADVVVVGGGVMGCSILHALAEKGLTDALLLEQDGLGSGSTGRSQAILRMHYSNEVTTRMAWESLKVFRSFEEVAGRSSGYVPTGYLLIVGQHDRAAMEQNIEMQKGLGVKTSVVSAEDLKDVAPQFAVAEDEACAFEPDSGYVDPWSVTQGYAERSKELGAELRMNETVTSVDVEGGRVTGVTTTQGTVSTPKVVVAAGPWSRAFMAALGVDMPLQTVRHQVITLRRPESLAADHAIVGDIVNSLSARPEAGRLTLVGVGEDEDVEVEAYDHGVDVAVAEDVARKLSARMPGMSDAEFRGGWSGLFTVSPDWHPLIDQVDGIDGLYCAAGFSGHGFKLAPMVGVAMAEMVVDGKTTTIDVSMLRLDRFESGRLMESRYRMSVLA